MKTFLLETNAGKLAKLDGSFQFLKDIVERGSVELAVGRGYYVGNRIYSEDATGASVRVEVFNQFNAPDNGYYVLQVELSGETETTAPIPASASAKYLQNCLNALTIVRNAGCVTVTNLCETSIIGNLNIDRKIVWNTPSATTPVLTVSENTLSPAFAHALTTLTTGSATMNQSLSLTFTDTALVDTTLNTVAAHNGITITQISTASATTNEGYQVTVDGIYTDGSFVLNWAGERSGEIYLNASEGAFATALPRPNNEEYRVVKNGENSWQVWFLDNVAHTAPTVTFDNLNAFEHISGTVDFSAIAPYVESRCNHTGLKIRLTISYAGGKVYSEETPI